MENLSVSIILISPTEIAQINESHRTKILLSIHDTASQKSADVEISILDFARINKNLGLSFEEIIDEDGQLL